LAKLFKYWSLFCFFSPGPGRRKRGSRPISRVLSRTVIHLGQTSPPASSNLPGNARGPRAAIPEDGLLPYLVLLRMGFTVPRHVATRAVRSYRTFSPLPAPPERRRLGGIFSVALSVGSHPPGVTWHPALRSPDFPPRTNCSRRLSGRLPSPVYRSVRFYDCLRPVFDARS